jgi:hypothetical protein
MVQAAPADLGTKNEPEDMNILNEISRLPLSDLEQLSEDLLAFDSESQLSTWLLQRKQSGS